MIVAIVFAHLWGVFELLILGGSNRTIRFRTALAAVAVGLYACASVAVVLMLTWTRPIALMTAASIRDVVRLGSYTLDPFIEELLKIAPLALLLRLPAVRRQWSTTDCVLIGAATGSGFGLAEALFRYGASANAAHSISGGWAIQRGFFAPVIIPSTTTSLTS